MQGRSPRSEAGSRWRHCSRQGRRLRRRNPVLSERPGQLLPIDEDEHGTYIMNSRDLCAIHLLAKMKDAGINSFKIEGRTKSVYYVSMITRAYRKAIDDLQAGRQFDENLEQEMFSVANRGYITGFLENNPRHFGENFDYSHSENQTHQFLAIVRKLDKKNRQALIAVRNRIEKGDEVEAVFPSGSICFTIDQILTVDGQAVEVAHGGGKDVFITVPDQVDEYSLIRKPVKLLEDEASESEMKYSGGT